jgi:gluconate kinase
MKTEMLRSQWLAFEAIGPSENAIVVDGMDVPEAIVAAIIQQARDRFAGFERSWWERLRL